MQCPFCHGIVKFSKHDYLIFDPFKLARTEKVLREAEISACDNSTCRTLIKLYLECEIIKGPKLRLVKPKK